MLLAMMMTAALYAHPEQLVETDWVAVHATDADVRVVDMRRSGFDRGHVPGAVYLDPDSIRDAHNPPTFLPSAESFARTMRNLGIGDRTRVVAYDERGGLYAARLWWILNYFGHKEVALLNGQWIKWSAEHRPTSTEDAAPRSVMFTPRPQPRLVATASDVVGSINKPGVRIVDARTQAEIDGKDLRNIRRGGYIESSVPVYWEDLLDPQSKVFKSADELKTIFESRSVRPSDEVIVYCQVGMRASVDLFAMHLLGYDHLRNYYGAWEEWGNRDDLPIVKRP